MNGDTTRFQLLATKKKGSELAFGPLKCLEKAYLLEISFACGLPDRLSSTTTINPSAGVLRHSAGLMATGTFVLVLGATGTKSALLIDGENTLNDAVPGNEDWVPSRRL